MPLLLSLGHRYACAEYSSPRPHLPLPRASHRSPQRSKFKRAIVWPDRRNDKSDPDG